MACGMVGVRSPPSDHALREMYSDERSFEDFAAASDNEKTRARRRRVSLEIRAMMDGTDAHSGVSVPRLFDVGAGAGDFLNEARKAGFEVSGNDFSMAAIQSAWTQYHVDVDSKSLGDEQRSAHFDAVTMWGVPEHVRAPMDRWPTRHGFSSPAACCTSTRRLGVRMTASG